MTPRPVLFDVDGVLLDSAEIHRRVWTTWARQRHLDPFLVVALTPGRRPEDTVRDAAPHLDPGAERRALDGLMAAAGGVVPAVVGAAEVLARMSRRPWAIVTSGSAATVRPSFARAGLPLPAVQVYGEDVAESKPSPEGYLRAAALLGVPARSCVVVEDSPAGVAAGRAAGCTVIAVTATHPAEHLAADLHASSIAEVTRLLDDRLRALS